MIATGYQFRHSENNRKHVELQKSHIQKKRPQTPDQEVDEVVGWVIPDPRHSRGRDSKYAKIVDLYWHVKEIIACNMGREEANPIPVD
jgi:hypothetical protein